MPQLMGHISAIWASYLCNFEPTVTILRSSLVSLLDVERSFYHTQLVGVLKTSNLRSVSILAFAKVADLLRIRLKK